MEGKKWAPPRGVKQGTRIFGLETEYGFAVIGADGQQLDPAESAEQLMAQVRKLVPYLSCRGEIDLFIGNGSRVYIDIGAHPEVATAECHTPQEAVAYSRAGDLLLSRAARGLKRGRYGRNVEVVLWKGNVDHATKATWASHESYLHQAPQSQFARQLITHLVTRVVFTGTGGFDNRASGLRFVISPRAFHLEHTISRDSTCARGIFHTRDQPLAKRPNGRLHVLAGESLWSETADYLRVGTTALLVAQIDAGRRPQANLDLASPLDALATIAADVACSATVALKESGALTAISIQRRLLEGIEADLDADYMPAWAPALCRRWRLVLDRLEASPASLIGVLDWPTKHSVLRHQCETEGHEWVFSGEAGIERSIAGRVPRAIQRKLAARLRETDMRFSRLDDDGIFATLDREGALDHRIVPVEAVEHALDEPPLGGRARMRGACIKRLASNASKITCDWDRVTDYGKRVYLDLGDPFRSEGETWAALPRDTDGLSRQADPALGPIARALLEGDTRQALHEMECLLTSADPSESVCRYCADVIGSLVPSCPVPLLRANGETLGRILETLFAWVSSQDHYALQQHVGTLLYRCHEACGRYTLARPVIERLLVRAQQTGDQLDIASLTNNLGYEYLLEGRWETAEGQFECAIELFEYSGRRHDVCNARANLLGSRFEHTTPDDWVALVPMVVEVNRALSEGGDWRARKTLRLLARIAERRNRFRAARGWARKALAASEGVATQLRKWDRSYLQTLQGR